MQRQTIYYRLAMVLFFVVAAVFGTMRFAGADPVITEQQKTYDVLGQSLRNLNGQMFSGSPIIIKGRRHIAACHHDIKWRYTFAAVSDWCVIKTVAVTANITVTMPRWVDYANASAEMQKKWDTFYARLSEHEEGHAQYAREAARDIEREIGITKRRSCQELKEAVSETGSGILKRLSATNAEYDARTKHGVLNDAILHEF
jgi:predicted secreted Zn-dependent protease